jgi:glycosyltransferase involved in cell wall biosynthesis
MNVFLKGQVGLSKAMDRIIKQLMRHKPSYVQIVDDPLDSDLVILHVIGFPETEETVKRLVSLGKKYAIIQYCLRTTQKPDCASWIPIWQGAELVWSYYDLQELCREDGVEFPVDTLFYYAPLGVDTGVFNKGLRPRPYPYKILTTGTLAPHESVDLVNIALQVTGGRQVHIGQLEQKRVGFKDELVDFFNEISDPVLAQKYRLSEYVSGLRRVEGFELPAAEGLVCGARPILFDKPHYRQWYEDLGAIFIPEEDDSKILLSLKQVLGTPLENWPPLDIDAAIRRFDWGRICNGFWDSIPRIATRREVVECINSRPSRGLVWVGDAVASTGFAKGTHKILEYLRPHWDVHVLGLNYYGDPHDYPYKIYPAPNGGDFFGVKRLPWLLEKVRPELVVIQNDPWNFPLYMKAVGNVPAVGIVAVDGLNCRGNELNGLQHAIFWTEFGAKEAALGGYRGTSTVIPLGVDLNIYRPIDKIDARKAMGLPPSILEGFIIGNVNRNQPRKRLDLMIQYFAEWVKNYRITDAYLYLHVAPTGDHGYDVKQLMRYYGLNGRLILAQPEIMYGVKEAMMPYTYNSFDIQLSTTQGEGFGLTTLEGMACGVPQIVPDWSALGELFRDSADLIPCSSTIATPNDINVIGGVPDKDAVIGAIRRYYKNPMYTLQKQHDVLRRAHSIEFDWANIGQKYVETLDNVFAGKLVNA